MIDFACFCKSVFCHSIGYDSFRSLSKLAKLDVLSFNFKQLKIGELSTVKILFNYLELRGLAFAEQLFATYYH